MIERYEQPRDWNEGICSIAAAIIGGVASLAGGVVSAVGSSSAADTQANAANQAAQLQQQQYQQTRQDLLPYNQQGQTALSTVGQDQANGTGFAAPFTQSSFMSDPGYQFQLQQGQNAINSSSAATGGVLNGGTLKALDQYTTGLANTTYGDAYNRYLANSQQQYNQLLGVSQLGESAASQTGNAGTAAANNAGNYLTQAGNASAAGTVGVTNGINQSLSGLGVLGYAGLQGLQSQSSYAGASGFGSSPTNLSGLINPGSYSTGG